MPEKTQPQNAAAIPTPSSDGQVRVGFSAFRVVTIAFALVSCIFGLGSGVAIHAAHVAPMASTGNVHQFSIAFPGQRGLQRFAPLDPFTCYLTINAHQIGNSLEGEGDNFCGNTVAELDFSAMDLWGCVRGRTASGVVPFTCSWVNEGAIGPGCNYTYTPVGTSRFCPASGWYHTATLVPGTYYLVISAAATDLDGDIASGTYDTAYFTIS